MAAWQDIPWTKVHRHVFRLQKRIYRATQQGRVRTARKLQKLLMKSWYARLLAVRRITQDNKGKRTAGMGCPLRRDSGWSIAYSAELISSTISATLQSTDRHHGIVGQERCHFQRDS
jgi:uncharacterized NAD(P)/FAD-binding protein YdhS